jgi:hypothetical protein
MLINHSATRANARSVLPAGQVPPLARAPGLKIPHMGWNEVRQVAPHALWKGIGDASRFYFVHSYYCDPSDRSLAAGLTEYPGAFTSAIARDNIFATQFHPPKQRAGLTPPAISPTGIHRDLPRFHDHHSRDDLKDGHCVRLEQGRMDSATVFSKEPAKAAAQWAAKGARRLHVVDLDGAIAGKPRNEGAIKAIIAAVDSDIPVQMGGGIRDLETIERCLDDGVSFVIIGTAAVKNPGFLHEACDAFPGHIIVGLDAKDGKVATDGWSKLTGHDVVDPEGFRTTASRR